jgi:hypothetical protein
MENKYLKIIILTFKKFFFKIFLFVSPVKFVEVYAKKRKKSTFLHIKISGEMTIGIFFVLVIYSEPTVYVYTENGTIYIHRYIYTYMLPFKKENENRGDFP